MPRDGANVYSKASASFVPLQVASSAAVNADFDDLVTDANTPRAIVMGGTGQSTPLGAHDAFVAAGNVVASAATLAIDAVVGPLIDISGVAAVTAVTLAAGKLRIARATGAFTLTASASLVVNTSQTVNYIANVGDLLIFEGYAAGVVRVWAVGPAAVLAVSAVASAATTPIGAAASAEVNITGTTNITAFDTVAAGIVREGYFSGALTLTHNAVSLILPGGANITTAANDRFRALSLGGGNWIVLSYTPAANSVLPAVAPGGLFGCVLSNDGGTPATVLDVSAGVVTDSTNTYSMTIGAFTKTIAGTWAVGTGNGGLDTGVAANSTYHVFVIKRLDTGVTDVLFSLSATAPTMPANYTIKRRIGSMMRLAGSWVVFVQNGDDFQLTTAVQDVNTTTPGTAQVTSALTVPLGIVVNAQIVANVVNGAVTGSDFWASSLDATNQVPTASIFAQITNVGSNAGATTRVAAPLVIKTNTSGQIGYRVSFSSASVTVSIVTRGWTDTRGRSN